MKPVLSDISVLKVHKNQSDVTMVSTAPLQALHPLHAREVTTAIIIQIIRW